MAAMVIEDHHLNHSPFGRQMCRWIVPRLVRRAAVNWKEGNYYGAWNNLLIASRIAPHSYQRWINQQKNGLVEFTISQADENLQAGRIDQAIEILRGLSNLKILDWRADRIASSTQLIHQSECLIAEGKLQAAMEKLMIATRQRPDLHYLPIKIEALRLAGRQQFITLNGLSVKSIPPVLREGADPEQQTHAQAQSFLTDTSAGNSQTNDSLFPSRKAWVNVIMWIDGVGGYRLCPSLMNWIGRHVDESRISIPIRADLHRYHACFKSVVGGHVLHGEGNIMINGQVVPQGVEHSRWLADGDRIELNDRVQLCYSLSKQFNGTARLDMESAHRTSPSCDAIFLVNQSLSISDSPAADIRFPGLPGEIVILRQDNSLAIEATGIDLHVDGRQLVGKIPLNPDSRISGADLSIQFEPLAWSGKEKGGTW